jgi:hypothetical protein
MSEAHRRATRLWPTVGRAAHERHKVATSGGDSSFLLPLAILIWRFVWCCDRCLEMFHLLFGHVAWMFSARLQPWPIDVAIIVHKCCNRCSQMLHECSDHVARYMFQCCIFVYICCNKC